MNSVTVDLYSQPKLLQLFIDNALASSVTVFCSNGSGSAWAIDLTDDMATSRDDAYPTELVTNHHVIEGCESSGVTIVPMGTQDKYDAYVYSYDQTNDLAILMTSRYLPPLATVQPGNEAKVGQWVMAVGSPGVGSTTLDGTITKGTITNLREDYVITDTTINPGNSGGPLLNAAGEVIAVVSAKIVDAYAGIGADPSHQRQTCFGRTPHMRANTDWRRSVLSSAARSCDSSESHVAISPRNSAGRVDSLAVYSRPKSP